MTFLPQYAQKLRDNISFTAMLWRLENPITIKIKPRQSFWKRVLTKIKRLAKLTW